MPKLIQNDACEIFWQETANGGYVDFASVLRIFEARDIGDLSALITGEAALQILFSLCMQNSPCVQSANLRHLCPALKVSACHVTELARASLASEQTRQCGTERKPLCPKSPSGLYAL
jgi:hypothetical protein